MDPARNLSFNLKQFCGRMLSMPSYKGIFFICSLIALQLNLGQGENPTKLVLIIAFYSMIDMVERRVRFEMATFQYKVLTS